MSGVKLESVQCVKTHGVAIVSNLELFQHCKETTGKANKMMGFINKQKIIKNKSTFSSIHLFSQTQFGVCSAILVALPCKT